MSFIINFARERQILIAETGYNEKRFIMTEHVQVMTSYQDRQVPQNSLIWNTRAYQNTDNAF